MRAAEAVAIAIEVGYIVVSGFVTFISVQQPFGLLVELHGTVAGPLLLLEIIGRDRCEIPAVHLGDPELLSILLESTGIIMGRFVALGHKSIETGVCSFGLVLESALVR